MFSFFFFCPYGCVVRRKSTTEPSRTIYYWSPYWILKSSCLENSFFFYIEFSAHNYLQHLKCHININTNHLLCSFNYLKNNIQIGKKGANNYSQKIIFRKKNTTSESYFLWVQHCDKHLICCYVTVSLLWIIYIKASKPSSKPSVIQIKYT